MSWQRAITAQKEARGEPQELSGKILKMEIHRKFKQLQRLCNQFNELGTDEVLDVDLLRMERPKV